MLETAINSFVLRFVQESNPDVVSGGGDVEWHGVIRHVQSDTELRFVQMDEALAFIAIYVPLPPASLATRSAGEAPGA